MPPARAARRGRVSPLLLLFVSLALIGVVSVTFQKTIANSQLGRMLAGSGGSSRGSGGRSRRLSAGEVQMQLNAIGKSTRVQLEPDLLRHIHSIAKFYRDDEAKFLKWAKDVGLLRLQQYQDYLREAAAGTLPEVDPQEKPRGTPDLTSTFLDLDILRRAYRAALAAADSELHFVQWMRGAGMLSAESYAQLEARLADDKAAVADKLEWEAYQQMWVKLRQKIEERRKRAQKAEHMAAVSAAEI